MASFTMKRKSCHSHMLSPFAGCLSAILKIHALALARWLRSPCLSPKRVSAFAFLYLCVAWSTFRLFWPGLMPQRGRRRRAFRKSTPADALTQAAENGLYQTWFASEASNVVVLEAHGNSVALSKLEFLGLLKDAYVLRWLIFGYPGMRAPKSPHFDVLWNYRVPPDVFNIIRHTVKFVAYPSDELSAKSRQHGTFRDCAARLGGFRTLDSLDASNLSMPLREPPADM